MSISCLTPCGYGVKYKDPNETITNYLIAFANRLAVGELINGCNCIATSRPTIPISNVTNTPNPQITTPIEHGLLDGTEVNIQLVLGATGVNGSQTVTVIDQYNFSLPALIIAPGNYIAGGIIYLPSDLLVSSVNYNSAAVLDSCGNTQAAQTAVTLGLVSGGTAGVLYYLDTWITTTLGMTKFALPVPKLLCTLGRD
jgi:hypothetical protein